MRRETRILKGKKSMYSTGRWVLFREEVGAEWKPTWWTAQDHRVLSRPDHQLVVMCLALVVLVQLHRFLPPGRLHLSTLVSVELLSRHPYQGLPSDGGRGKCLTPPTQERGLEPGGCPSWEKPCNWKIAGGRTHARSACVLSRCHKLYCSS